MGFSFSEYIDDQFESFQKLIGELSDSIPIVEPATATNEQELITALVDQNKAYAQKILHLFEELSNEAFARENQLDSTKDNFLASQVHEGQRTDYNNESRRSVSVDNGKANPEELDSSHLLIKIEYLNELFMEEKKFNEQKDAIIKEISQQNEALNEQLSTLSRDKEQAEKDLEDVMEEFLIVKKKYEEVVSEKEKLVLELRKKSGTITVTPRKSEPERIPESNEEVEELKEKLEAKEKEINKLRTQVDNFSVDNPKEIISEDSSLLQKRIVELGTKLRELRTVIYNLASKSAFNPEERASATPTKQRKEKSDQDDLLSLVENEHLKIVEEIRRISVGLLNRPAPVETSPNVSERRRTSVHTTQFVEDLLRSKEDIEEQLRVTLLALAERNKDEMVQQLEEEIEKNSILNEKVIQLSQALQKILLSVQEDFERLSLIHEYARKTITTEELRNQILTCKNKVADLLNPELVDNLTLDEEYEHQRNLWQEKIVSQAAQFTEDLTILREELENQKNITIQKELDFNNQISTIKRDYEESKKQYSQELERHLERVDYLEQEKENTDKYINELKRNKAELQHIISEREETILEYTHKISEWQAKCSFIENDIRKALNEKGRMQEIVFEREKELDYLREDLSKLQNNLRRQTEAFENLERDHRAKTQEISQKTARLHELEITYDTERKKLWEQIEHLKVEHRAYAEELERNTDILKDNYENLLNEYNVQLEDLRRYSEQMKKNHEIQIENHVSEIRRLSHSNEEAIALSKSQAESLRTKEEKLSRLTEEFRSLEFKARTMEDSLTEMTTIKDKNKRYFELLTQSNSELNNTKVETQGLINERNEALEKSNKLEKGYIDIREELRKAIEKNERTKELLQESQNEVKGLKEELDRNHKKLVEKEKEMRGLNEEFNKQSKTTIGYKEETINRLKSDLKQVTNDYESLRREYQDIIERNEDVLVQNEKLKQIIFDKEVNFNEIEKLNNLNDDLLVQNEQLKNEKRVILDDAEKEKRNLSKEINTLKNKIFELQTGQGTRNK